MTESKPLVGILMGSESDWDTMRHAPLTLDRFGVANESRVASAHRSPELATSYARGAKARGLQVIIAAAGGAAHLAGVIAAHTPLPVFGVPMLGWSLNGLDALLSTAQMPKGVPVGTLAIGKAGAINAALLAIRVLALHDPELAAKLEAFHAEEAQKIANTVLEL